MSRAIRFSLVAPLVLLLACQDYTSEPSATGETSVAFKKEGGGKPGDGAPADPAIAYTGGTACSHTSGMGLWVVNADGSNKTDLRDCNSSPGVAAWLSAWSPDGNSIAFYDVALNELYAVDVALDAQGHPIAQNRRLLVSTGDVATPAWSPVGDVIAYSFADTLFTVPATGGSPTVVCLGCGDDPTWSPDGAKLAFESNTALKTITLITGDIQTLIPGGLFERIYWPEWSRSGDRIVFDGTPLGSEPRGTYVFDLVTGDYFLLTDLGFPASWSPDDQELVVTNRGYRGGGGMLVVNSTTGAVVRKVGKSGGSWPDWRRCAPGPGCGPGN